MTPPSDQHFSPETVHSNTGHPCTPANPAHPRRPILFGGGGEQAINNPPKPPILLTHANVTCDLHSDTGDQQLLINLAADAQTHRVPLHLDGASCQLTDRPDADIETTQNPTAGERCQLSPHLHGQTPNYSTQRVPPHSIVLQMKLQGRRAEPLQVTRMSQCFMCC